MDNDESGHVSLNPMYMKYTADANGHYNGQLGYGYRSIEDFVLASTQLNNGVAKSPHDFDKSLATVHSTASVTAILHAGRLSLDNGGKRVVVHYDEHGVPDKLVLQ